MERMKQLGLDLVVIIQFTPEFMKIRASQFVAMLVRNLSMTELWIGHDFRFGYQREGDFGFLQARGTQLGFAVHQITPVTIDGQVVSSTRIRTALQIGNVALVKSCLGRE